MKLLFGLMLAFRHWVSPIPTIDPSSTVWFEGSIPGLRGSPKEVYPMPATIYTPTWMLPTTIDPIRPYGYNFKE
jgi:hypothetical protein